MLTFDQSSSSSSAIIWAKAVPTCCPNSCRKTCTVVSPLLCMVNHTVGSKFSGNISGLPGSSRLATLPATADCAITRPPIPDTEVIRNFLLDKADSVMIAAPVKLLISRHCRRQTESPYLCAYKSCNGISYRASHLLFLHPKGLDCSAETILPA